LCYLSLLHSTAIKSIPADDADTVSIPSQLKTIANADNINPTYQPEVFVAAKTIHLRFLNLVSQLKQQLKECDPKRFLAACRKLTASTSHFENKYISLIPPEFLEDLDNASTEVILNRLAFLWSWINPSVLRALLEACNCPEGIKMLDDFESQIDTDQPMEWFPIPPPSMKMAPSSSSAYTVLSIRGEHHQNELVPLQYVRKATTVIVEKFCVSPHALQLLGAWASSLMLYWMIPKNIVPLITKKVYEHFNFLKEKGFSEIAIYPNTILFVTKNVSLGSFYLLRNLPQVSNLFL